MDAEASFAPLPPRSPASSNLPWSSATLVPLPRRPVPPPANGDVVYFLGVRRSPSAAAPAAYDAPRPVKPRPVSPRAASPETSAQRSVGKPRVKADPIPPPPRPSSSRGEASSAAKQRDRKVRARKAAAPGAFVCCPRCQGLGRIPAAALEEEAAAPAPQKPSAGRLTPRAEAKRAGSGVGAKRKRQGKGRAKVKARVARRRRSARQEEDEAPVPQEADAVEMPGAEEMRGLFGPEQRGRNLRAEHLRRLWGRPAYPTEAWLRPQRYGMKECLPASLPGGADKEEDEGSEGPRGSRRPRRAAKDPKAAAFRAAAEAGDVDRVAAVFAWPSTWETDFQRRSLASIPKPDFDFLALAQSPLIDAAMRGQVRLVYLMLMAAVAIDAPRAKAWLERTGRCGYTALFGAATTRANVPVVEMLGAVGANALNWDVRGNSILGLAADVNDYLMVRVLLLLGCDPAEPSRDGRTPLGMVVAQCRRNPEFAMVRALLLAALPTDEEASWPPDMTESMIGTGADGTHRPSRASAEATRRQLVDDIQPHWRPRTEADALAALFAAPDRPQIFQKMWSNSRAVKQWDEAYIKGWLADDVAFAFNKNNKPGLTSDAARWPGGDCIFGNYDEFCRRADAGDKAYVESIGGGAVVLPDGTWDFEASGEGEFFLGTNMDPTGRLKTDVAMKGAPRPFNNLINDLVEVSRRRDKGRAAHCRRITRLYLSQMRDQDVHIKWHQDKHFSQFILNVRGTKVFTLHPPTGRPHFWQHTNVDLSLTREFTLREGDVLYLPAGWVHMVKTPAHAFACTINFGVPPLTPDTNCAAFARL